MKRSLAALVMALSLVSLAACSSDDEPAGASPSASPTQVEFDQELHDELVRMEAQDQDERTSGATLNDTERTERLKQIIAEHGWPTYDLVGKDGEDAAWVIAQHSDLDPEFQATALELLRAAVEDGQASPGNLAYLEDRVRAGQGEPQLYGTQVGCGKNGAKPGPIEDPDGLDERREEAGLPPYDRYLDRMDRICRTT